MCALVRGREREYMCVCERGYVCVCVCVYVSLCVCVCDNMCLRLQERIGGVHMCVCNEICVSLVTEDVCVCVRGRSR